jgi:hypothetical protein
MPTHSITCTYVGISFVVALVTFCVFCGLAFVSYTRTIDAPIWRSQVIAHFNLFASWISNPKSKICLAHEFTSWSEYDSMSLNIIDYMLQHCTMGFAPLLPMPTRLSNLNHFTYICQLLNQPQMSWIRPWPTIPHGLVIYMLVQQKVDMC